MTPKLNLMNQPKGGKIERVGLGTIYGKPNISGRLRDEPSKKRLI